MTDKVKNELKEELTDEVTQQDIKQELTQPVEAEGGTEKQGIKRPSEAPANGESQNQKRRRSEDEEELRRRRKVRAERRKRYKQRRRERKLAEKRKKSGQQNQRIPEQKSNFGHQNQRIPATVSVQPGSQPSSQVENVTNHAVPMGGATQAEETDVVMRDSQMPTNNTGNKESSEQMQRKEKEDEEDEDSLPENIMERDCKAEAALLMSEGNDNEPPLDYEVQGLMSSDDDNALVIEEDNIAAPDEKENGHLGTHSTAEMKDVVVNNGDIDDKQARKTSTIPAVSNDCLDEKSLEDHKRTDKFNRKKKTRKTRAHYEPRLWKEGVPSGPSAQSARINAAKTGIPKCVDTCIAVDADKEKSFGTLWKELREQETANPRLKDSDPQMDSIDALKAISRLGKMIHPERMAALLDGDERNEEYCRFVLSGFLSIYNISRTRQILKGVKQIGEITAQAPGDFAALEAQVEEEEENSDEELLMSAEGSMEEDEDENSQEKDTENANTGGKDNALPAGAMSNDAPLSISSLPKAQIEDVERGEMILTEDEDSSDENENAQHRDKQSEPSGSIDANEGKPIHNKRFERHLSSVTRTYMRNVTGAKVRFFRDFIVHCSNLGMSFNHHARHVAAEEGDRVFVPVKRFSERLKWLTEPMPAPEIGKSEVVQLSSVQLWRHALMRFPRQQLSRISLINYNHLLDWLAYASLSFGKKAETEQEFNRYLNVITSIAPIPLLYLADLAANLALRILQVAVLLDEREPLEFEAEPQRGLEKFLTDADIKRAFDESKPCGDNELLTPYIMFQPQLDFPELLIRPISEAEEFVLSSTAPENRIRVPVNDVHEAKAVLDSVKRMYRRFFYARSNDFGRLDQWKVTESKEVSLTRQWRHCSEVTMGSGAADKSGDHESQEEHPEDETENDKNLQEQGNVISENQLKQSDEKVESKPKEGAETNDKTEVGCPTTERSNTAGEAHFKNLMEQNLLPILLGDDVKIFDPYLNVPSVADVYVRQHEKKELEKRGKQLSKRSPIVSHVGDVPVMSNSKVWESIGKLQKAVNPHRLAWICLHALGIKHNHIQQDSSHVLDYGHTTDYTEFGEFTKTNKVSISQHGFDTLLAIVEQQVRREAEILMECAAHDDGRPWIDRADVVLVTSVRKQKFKYGNIGL